MRIVSLLPSATETVLALGLDAELVGVTHECDYPLAARAKPKVTRTQIPTGIASAAIDELVRAQISDGESLYSLDFEALAALRPDLIITQTLCRVCAVSDREVATALEQLPGPPRCLYLEPRRLEDVFSSIRAVADAAGVPARGAEYVGQLRARLETVRRRAADAAARPATYPCGTPRPGGWTRPPRVAVLEWLDPLFGAGHWTPELVELVGGVEPLAQPGDSSRQISPSELAAADPDVLVIACCGFDTLRTLQDVTPFLAREEIANLRCVREGRVYVTDGNAYFSRPGPRLVEATELLAHTIAPRVHPLPDGVAPMVRITAG